MKDIKSILIAILLGFCIFFFSIWYLKGSGYKKEYKKLEQQFNVIQKSRDSLKTVNKKLKSDYLEIDNRIKLREIFINSIEKELEKTKEELKSAKLDLKKWESDYKITKKKIEDLKKNPIKREDDQLVKSLKEKLK